MTSINSTIIINDRTISPEHPPYVIAEISANHNGKIENAFELIRQAKHAGASAVKLQTYRPDTITIDCDNEDFQIHGGLWDGRTLFDLYKEAHMPWEWHAPLFSYAKELGITIFSSPFDFSAVDLLEELGTPAYKIASFEAIDIPLIQYVARTGKPMIISTGMANKFEISEAVDAAKQSGCRQLALLHCVSGYPTPAAEYNLHTIPDMIERFGCVTGLSDHTLDNATAIAAVALGATIIEKHFTLDRNAGGPDDSFSLEPSDLKSLCQDTLTAWSALGRIDYSRQPTEQDNLKFRRSLYFIKDMLAGEQITAECIKSIRPGFGLAPKEYARVLNCRTKIAVARGTPVRFEHLC
jgi:N-acetylneuraminate synthase